jgi:hypothetical protein
MISTSMYKLGKFEFKLKNCEQQFLDIADSLLLAIKGSDSAEDLVDAHVLNTGCEKDINAIIAHARKKHYPNLWIESACVKTPLNKTMLLCGGARAGKSVAAAALALAFDWKIISEDLTFIDKTTGAIIPFCCPILMKPNDASQIAEALSIPEPQLIAGVWWDVKNHAEFQPPHNLDFIVFLDTVSNEKFIAQRTSADAISTRLLSISNALRVPSGMERLYNLTTNSDCWDLSGGTLKERLDFLRLLVS